MAHDDTQEDLDRAVKALEGALRSPAPEMIALRTAIGHLIAAVQGLHNEARAERVTLESK